jgi:hypothetical protein
MTGSWGRAAGGLGSVAVRTESAAVALGSVADRTELAAGGLGSVADALGSVAGALESAGGEAGCGRLNRASLGGVTARSATRSA